LNFLDEITTIFGGNYFLKDNLLSASFLHWTRLCL